MPGEIKLKKALKQGVGRGKSDMLQSNAVTKSNSQWMYATNCNEH
jgi:hypothetical protein